MEKKVAYSKPLMVMERFTPQEYVAGCPAPVPGTVIYQDNGAFYADIYDASGYSGTFGQSDGECHVQNECFSMARNRMARPERGGSKAIRFISILVMKVQIKKDIIQGISV